jgi:hypothetical protein
MIKNKILCSIEIPLYSTISGGIQRMFRLAIELNKRHNVHLRIQKINNNLDYSKIDFQVPYSIGIPDSSFPKSDIVIINLSQDIYIKALNSIQTFSIVFIFYSYYILFL